MNSRQQRESSFIALFLPLLFSGLFGQIYPVLSTSLISHRLDMTALASVGALAPYSVMQSAFFAGLGTGIGLSVSLALNQEENDQLPVLKKGGRVIAGTALAAGVLLALGAGPLCRFAGVPGTLLEGSIRYLTVLLLGSGLLTVKTALVQIHQNIGHVTFASAVTMSAVVLQSVFAVLLFLCFPGEVWYVPMSTLLSNLAVCLWLFFALRRSQDHPGTVTEAGFLSRDVRSGIRNMTVSGLSRSGMMMLIGAGGFLMQRSINQLSTEIISGYSCGNVAVNLFMEPLNACAVLATVYMTGKGAAAMAGKALHIERSLLIKAGIYCLAVLLVFPVAGRWILCLLSGEGARSAVVEAGYLRLLITLPAFFPLSVYLTGRNILQLLRPKVLYLLGICEFLCEVAGAAAVTRAGYAAAPAAIASAWIIGAVLCAVFLLKEGRAGR